MLYTPNGVTIAKVAVNSAHIEVKRYALQKIYPLLGHDKQYIKNTAAIGVLQIANSTNDISIKKEALEQLKTLTSIDKDIQNKIDLLQRSVYEEFLI